MISFNQTTSKTQLLPSLLHVPESLRSFTAFYKDKQANKEKQESLAEDSTFMKNTEWQPQHIDQTSNWGFLTAVTKIVVAIYGYPNVDVGLSTRANGSLMYTYQSSSTIYWNAYAANTDLGKDILRDLRVNNGQLHKATLESLIEAVAHELVHAQQEYPGEQTHNHAFYKKQQALLLKMTEPEMLDQLIEEIEQVYQQHGLDNHELSLEDLSSRPMKRRNTAASEVSMFTNQVMGGNHSIKEADNLETEGALDRAI